MLHLCCNLGAPKEWPGLLGPIEVGASGECGGVRKLLDGSRLYLEIRCELVLTVCPQRSNLPRELFEVQPWTNCSATSLPRVFPGLLKNTISSCSLVFLEFWGPNLSFVLSCFLSFAVFHFQKSAKKTRSSKACQNKTRSRSNYLWLNAKQNSTTWHLPQTGRVTKWQGEAQDKHASNLRPPSLHWRGRGNCCCKIAPPIVPKASLLAKMANEPCRGQQGDKGSFGVMGARTAWTSV